MDAAAPGVQQWTLEEVLRIGSVDDPAYAFTFIGALEIGPDGSLYTLHPRDAQLRRWTPEGEPAGTIGRRGEGPGEFEAPSRMGWDGDTLWVMDRRTNRITWFAPDGTYVRDVTPHVDYGSVEMSEQAIFPPRPETRMSDGSLHAMTPGFSQEIVQGRLTEIVHVRMSVDGTPLDTLAVVPTGKADVLGIIRGDGGTYSQQPFGDGYIATLDDEGGSLLVLDRTAVADAEGRTEWTLTRIGLEGDTLFRRSYPYEPIPIPTEAVDSAIGAQAGNLHEWLGERTGTPLSKWEEDVRAGLHLPEHYPPVDAVRGGRDGTIWVRIVDPARDAATWEVLDASGEPVARVETPSGFRMLAASRDEVWGVERDELDVEYLVRYRVVAP